jgi:hypothetical protein
MKWLTATKANANKGSLFRLSAPAKVLQSTRQMLYMKMMLKINNYEQFRKQHQHTQHGHDDVQTILADREGR